MLITKGAPTAGIVEFADAYKRAHAEANDNQKRNLAALASCLVESYGLANEGDLKRADVLELRSRVKTCLRERGRSAGYIRNQLSALNAVLRVAEIVPDHSETVEIWRNRLPHISDNADTGNERGRGRRRAREHFLWFVRETGLMPSTFDPDTHLRAFREFLRTHTDLTDSGGIRTIHRIIKDELAQSGYSFRTPTSPKPLPGAMESAIKAMGDYALNRQEHLVSKAGKQKLFAELEGNGSPIRENTWEATASDLRRYLRFHRTRTPDDFEETTLARYLDLERVKEFFSDAHEREKFTAATGETWIVRLNRIHLYATRTRIPGFETATEESHEKYSREIWSLIPHLRKHLRSSAVRERLEKRGGLPTWEDLHRSFETTSKIELKTVLNKIKRSKTLNGDARLQLDRQVALKLEEYLMIAFHLYFACRKHDMRKTIEVGSLKRLGVPAFQLQYLPSKTSGNARPSMVDAPVPPWLVPILELYLFNYQPLIYPGASLLFPADARLKRLKIARPGAAKEGNYTEWLSRVSRRYFGMKLSATDFRYVLTNFFAKNGLSKLYAFIGHNPDVRTSQLTRMEIDNYLRWGDRERISHARRHYESVVEILPITEEFVVFMNSFRKVKA
jgi:hypothetical protein